jgi:hypothetical protein
MGLLDLLVRGTDPDPSLSLFSFFFSHKGVEWTEIMNAK